MLKSKLSLVLRSSKAWWVLTAGVVTILIFDGIITKLPIYDLRVQVSQDTGIFFALISIISAVSQLLYLKIIGKRYSLDSHGDSASNYVRQTHLVVTSVQCVIIGSLLILVAEVTLLNLYDTYSVRISILLSIALSIGVSGILVFQLCLWLRKRPDHIVLAYAIATALIAVNSILIVVFISLEIYEEPVVIESTRMAISLSNLRYFELKQIQMSFGSIVFLSIWFASVLLLRLGRRRFGNLKFYAIVSLPLIYYFGFFEIITSELFRYTDILSPFQAHIFDIVNSSLTRPIGGLLFGVAFLTVARSLKERAVGDYMKFAAFGMMLLSMSTQDAELYNLPYPPFGVPTVSFIGISSYLLFTGIYYSAISISLNQHIRSSIHKSVEKQLDFVSKIGASQLEEEVEQRVARATKRMAQSLEQQSGVEIPMEKEDIDEYIRLAIEEAQKSSKGKEKKTE